ncbi:2Fe-2S iron-sulfur cluster-binding protein [Nioella nitratireducens]|uniref:2Fe-2S iron-sulfur cluster-binding protein n=1 Tax=Nioella nitratireducens TaxID=1287720 RepID=UPI0008FD6970|nr:2Fe-2S iron-sulfur cluster-binding protein [Nioella nitratireducens]
MPKVTFIDADGTETTVAAKIGDSVMQTAMAHGIDGITAECGGAMACATCHAYVADDWADKVGPAGETEADMLDFAACEVKPTSRLSCQIVVAENLDGLIVYLPEHQV